MWESGFCVELYVLVYLNMLSGNTDRNSSGGNTQDESSVGRELASYSSKLSKSGKSRQSHALNHFVASFFDEKVSLRKKVRQISFKLVYHLIILEAKRSATKSVQLH